MRLLVTGGAGFIGSHLVEKLVEKEYEVTVLDDFSVGKQANLDNVRDRTNIVRGSVCNLDLIRHLASDVDVIFHLATQCLVKGLEDPLLIHDVNDVGTYNICLASKEYNTKIVYVSSSEAYGPQRDFPIKESAPMNPVSLYGLTKLIGEQYTLFFHEIYDLPAVIIRPFNTFGFRQREDSYAGVITSFVKKLQEDKLPIIYGDGKQTRDFSYVDDIVNGVLLLSKLENGEIVNLGSNRDVSILELAHLIMNAWGFDANNVAFADARPNDLRKLCADISLAKRYGYYPKVSLEEGLKKYVKYYKSIRKRE